MSDGAAMPRFRFVLGGLAILAAIIVLAVPQVFGPELRGLLTTLSPEVILALLVALTALLVLLWRGRASDPRPESLVPAADETADPDRPAPGAVLERQLTGAMDLQAAPTTRVTDRTRLEDELRTIAEETVVLAAGCDPAVATAHIEAGTWTRDRRAAGLLGGPEAPSLPWYRLLVDMLRSEGAYHRQVRHVVAELHRIEEGESPALGNLAAPPAAAAGAETEAPSTKTPAATPDDAPPTTVADVAVPDESAAGSPRKQAAADEEPEGAA